LAEVVGAAEPDIANGFSQELSTKQFASFLIIVSDPRQFPPSPNRYGLVVRKRGEKKKTCHEKEISVQKDRHGSIFEKKGQRRRDVLKGGPK
jgi:hypothetical protein